MTTLVKIWRLHRINFFNKNSWLKIGKNSKFCCMQNPGRCMYSGYVGVRVLFIPKRLSVMHVQYNTIFMQVHHHIPKQGNKCATNCPLAAGNHIPNLATLSYKLESVDFCCVCSQHLSFNILSSIMLHSFCMNLHVAVFENFRSGASQLQIPGSL